ncbi:MAG: hypothetical protein ABL921_01920 [Pirellula sp.]
MQVAVLASTVLAALSAQQPAEQPVAPPSQQSHLHSSQEQTPVSQQHPPSGQQVSQAQTFGSAVKFDLFAKFAPIATPRPIKHNNTNDAMIFISFFRVKALELQLVSLAATGFTLV